ncbi:FUSC family protein [Candidatus Igneacidithiobacillus taiwanensis]|uniref:FUSC family protein n=1 Tax=Candidatus Igneacidithiobacillus taiwanensis TaxID=1945924 RepID=UPI00289E7780|nr:FUSC family protein [Candidatus Igneacidithiobacillus taiwanensis]MCE5360900.1 FUSC family protein [Acidithiobacillus sp.]
MSSFAHDFLQLKEKQLQLQRREPYLRSAIITVLVLIAYFLGYGLDELVPTHVTAAVIGALWSAVTVLAVFKDHWQETRTSFWATLSSGVLGAIAAVIYLTYIPANMASLAAVMSLSLLLSQLLGFADRGRQVVSTLLLIVIFSHLNTSAPWLNASMRMGEVVLGAGTGLLGGYLLHVYHASNAAQQP